MRFMRLLQRRFQTVFSARIRIATLVLGMFVAFAATLAATLPAETVVKKVLRFDSNAPNLLLSDGFRPYEKGFEKSGNVFLCDNGEDAAARRGVSQRVVIDQKVPAPIVAEAWSKAENISGSPSADYSLYLDIVYDDGSFLWGQSASFPTGTGDWERKRVVVMPEKPIKSLTYYTLFRNKTGKASFRDMKLTATAVGEGAVVFDGVSIVKSTPPRQADGPVLQIRHVTADSDFVLLETNGFGVSSHVEKIPLSGADSGTGEATTVVLKNETQEDRALTLVYAVPLEDWSDQRFCRMRHQQSLSESGNREHLLQTSYYGEVGSNGRLSKYPLSAVVGSAQGKEVGRAVGIDLAFPAFFRTGYNEATRELFVAVDFALTKESPEARFRFVRFDFEPKFGLRGALDVYRRIFPDFFLCRTPSQGVWMPFARISQVKGFEDFGFRFKEGNNETAWDDEHDILTFRYTEPMTWWMPLPKEMPRTYEAAVDQARKLADEGNRTAQALFVGGMKREDGRLAHLFRDTPWCNGVVWSFCDIPGIQGGGRDLKWSSAVADRLYGSEAAGKGILDGEYVDSSEGYVTAVLNFDRDHFRSVTTPLVFSRDTGRPAIFRGLVAYEYVRSMSEEVHRRGKLMMANSTPHGLCWLAPYLDVMGTETNWNRNGKWLPTPDDELIWRRVLCGPKPYCFLMNTDFTQWTYDMSERFMKRSLAYGMFPGFFSADASTKQYFTQPELYERDRPLFKKYVPLCREVAEAGWQPVPLAVSSHEKVYVERFGDDAEPSTWRFTLFNDSGQAERVTLRFEKGASPRWIDRVDGKHYETQENALTIELEPEAVAVLAPAGND